MLFLFGLYLKALSGLYLRADDLHKSYKSELLYNKKGACTCLLWSQSRTVRFIT